MTNSPLTQSGLEFPAQLAVPILILNYLSSLSPIFIPSHFTTIATMSWRNQGITGSNNIPLGNRRRFGGDSNGDSQNGSSYDSYGDASSKRGRSPSRGELTLFDKYSVADLTPAESAADGVKRRKKRNRWGDSSDNKAAGLMGLPTMIQANMTSEQLEAYTLHLRIEEISQKLRINDVVPADGDRYVFITLHKIMLTI